MCDEVQHQIEGLEPGEVLALVVDHRVSPQLPHKVELARVVDPGHVRPRELGQLDGERTGPSPCSVDQHPLTTACTCRSLHRDRPRLRQCRGLDEGQLLGLVSECCLPRHAELGETPLERQVVAVHLVTDPEPGDVRTDRRDASGDVGAQHPPGRGPQALRPRVHGRAT